MFRQIAAPGKRPFLTISFARTAWPSPPFSFLFCLLCALCLPAPVQAGFSDAEIAEIAQRMENGFDTCSTVGATYQIDCYRRVYERASKDLKGQRLQADAQRAMRRTAVELKRLVRGYQDLEVPGIEVAGKPVAAIRQEALLQAATQARRILQETETYLLRGTWKAAQHYQRIATVVNSSKVLIRSS